MAKLDDLIQQKQQRDEDWKAKKTAEREELRQLSDDAVMRVTSEPNAYLRYLDTQAINPQYSAANVMLAMAQNPDITYINSLENWGRLGRSVNREETGLKIRVSDPYVKDGRQYHGYKIGRVFDVTQTHGKAVPAPLTLRDNTPEMEAALSRLLDSAGVPVVTDAAMYQDAFYDPKAQRITVSTRLSDSKTFAALAREIVHAGIHDRGRYPYYSREDCAMDAECVSYMLCRNFSIDVPQPNVSRVGQAFDGMEAQDRRSVVDSLQKYFRNPMPESVKDRLSRCYEHIFLFSKSKKYFFDYKAISEPIAPATAERLKRGMRGGNKYGKPVPGQPQPQSINRPREHGEIKDSDINPLRNKRDVWKINTVPFKGGHYAAYPPKLVETCLLAGCPEGGIVLDPFMGSGTTGMVASQMERHFVGVELNPEYTELAYKRIGGEI